MQKRLFAIVAATLLAYGCDSPLEPEALLEVAPPPSFGVVNVPGDDPVLLGVTDWGELIRIDVAAGTATKIGTGGVDPVAGFEPGWTGIAFGPDGRLYVSSHPFGDTRKNEGCVDRFGVPTPCTHLYRINPVDGAIISDEGSLDYPNVTDIDWGTDGWLGASRTIADPFWGFVGGFLHVDPQMIGNPSSVIPDLGRFERASAVYPHWYPVGSGGVARHPLTGEWWGVEEYSIPALYRFDPVTGKAIEGSRGGIRDGNKDPGFGFSGLEIASSGRAFVVKRDEFELYEIDLNAAEPQIQNIPLRKEGQILGSLTGVTEGDIAAFAMSITPTRADVSFNLETVGADHFVISGTFTLDAGSDGIRPGDEETTVRLQALAETAPSGGLVRDEVLSLYRYTNSAPGITLLEIGDDNSFYAEGETSLSGVDQVSALFSLQVGNDQGAVRVLFTSIGQAPPRPQAYVIASTDRGELVSINFATGQSELLGRQLREDDKDIGWNGIAFAPNGNLYASARFNWGEPTDGCNGRYGRGPCSHLFIVEADSAGTFTKVGSTGLTFLTDLTFIGNDLRAGQYPDTPVDTSGAISSLSLVTGASTLLGRHGQDFTNGGLAYEEATGVLWVAEDEFGRGRLMKVDAATGAVLDAIQLTEGGSPIRFGFEGLQVMPSGVMIGVRYANKAVPDPAFQLYQISPSTGAVSVLAVDLPPLTGHFTSLIFAEGINRTPKANAGPDQVHTRPAPGLVDVVLDGGLSFDPDGTAVNPLTYEWQKNGVVFSRKVSATRSLDVGVHTFRLTVEDKDGAIRWDDVIVEILNVAPVAVAGSDTLVQAGTVASLSGASSSDIDGDITAWDWLVGAEVLASGETADLTLDAGTHAVTLRVTDNNGATAEDVVQVIVNAAPIAVASEDIVVRPGTAADLSAAGSSDPDGSITAWEWLIAGDVLATGETASLLLAEGTYTVTLRVTDDRGGTAEDVVQVTVIANAPPVAEAGNDIVVRIGTAADLSAAGSSDPDGSIVDWEWLINGQQEATGPTASLLLDVGTHTVTLRVTDNEGATAEDVVQVTVTPNAPPVADAGNDVVVQDGTAANLSAAGSSDPDGTITDWEWFIDGQPGPTGETVSLLLGVGTYTVTLRVTDDDGATAEDIVQVTVTSGGGPTEVVLSAAADAVLRPVLRNTNEGANPFLRLDDGYLPVLAFDLAGIDLSNVASATLVLTPDASQDTDGWGAGGGFIDAHRLNVEFVEGNGSAADSKVPDFIQGNGEGVTWNCRIDTQIQNLRRDCAKSERWDGGDFRAGATASFLQTNGAHDPVEFDVTADVVAGGARWLLKKQEGKQNGRGSSPAKFGLLSLFSREGAPDTASAPRLVIVFKSN